MISKTEETGLQPDELFPKQTKKKIFITVGRIPRTGQTIIITEQRTRRNRTKVFVTGSRIPRKEQKTFFITGN